MAGTKRKHGEDSPSQLYSNKSRSRPPIVEARVDPTYGQRSALPGLDNEPMVDVDEGGLSYDEDSMDALSYLRAVREEATGIPNLLVAPKNTTEAYDDGTYEDDVADYSGYYEDGAYYTWDSVPISSDIAEGEDRVVERDPQLAYFDSILSRFEALRAQLRQKPPPEIVAKLDSKHPIRPAKRTKSNSIAKWWRHQMETINPAPAQIASMDKSTVLRVLGSLTGGKLLKSGTDIKMSVSQWAWALLAKLPDRGELSSEEIGIIRELGKKAVLVGMGLKGEKDWQEGMHEVEAGFDEDEEEEETYPIVNEEEIQLDIDDDLDFGTDPTATESYVSTHGTSTGGPQIGPQLPSDLENARLDEQNSIDRNPPISSAKDLSGDGTIADIPMENQRTRLEAQSLSNSQPLISGMEEERLPSDEPLQDSEEAKFEAAKARILANLEKGALEDELNQEPQVRDADQEIKSSKWNTMATVDMILTVVGEMYGQLDLLEFRSAWVRDNVVAG